MDSGPEELKRYYEELIGELMKKCNDFDLLDLIVVLLQQHIPQI